MPRSKEDVQVILWRFKQHLKNAGIEPKPEALQSVCADIIERNIRAAMDQLVEGWSLSDTVQFLRAIEAEIEGGQTEPKRKVKKALQ